MSNDLQTKKLNYQLQEMAFQKQPYSINNKAFFCLETYFEDQLLNGVDLEIKEAKGMTSQPQKISYIAQSQQIIFPIGSNIICYNSQKRSYSLLTEVSGFVEILRTCTSKISNRTFIYWLQTDVEGLNLKKNIQTDPKSSKNINDESKEDKFPNKITSIWSISQPKGVTANTSNKLDSYQKIQTNKNMNSNKKRVNFTEEQKIKSKKKVKIQQPEQSKQKNYSKNKKLMRITIFDYQKKNILHKEPLQISQNQTISDIFLYYMAEKIVGYVINDETEARGKIYYKKIKVNQNTNGFQTTSKKILNKNKAHLKHVGKFNCLDSIFQIPLLKHNGQTDQYLFKDLNTVYSLQFCYSQFQNAVKQKKNDGEFPNDFSQLGEILFEDELEQYNQNIDEDQLSKQIQKITNKMILNSSKSDQFIIKDKYKIKINEEIEILSEQTIIDISFSEVYLVVLSTEFIRFYSIFNLNTLLFKSEIHDVKQNPPPSSVELNKSYILLTHQNSTMVSSYTILQRKLKYNSTCEVQIEHCHSIIKIFMNSYNCQVAILARQFQIEGRMTSILKSKKVIQNSYSTYKKTYIDINLAYLNFSSIKCEAKGLFLKNQRFRNILTCKWHSEYLIETQNQILAREWRQSFQNLKCSCYHPTGQYLIIGFNDCFKIYAVTQEGLHNTYVSDGVKDCQAIAYSEYGQCFAVGSGNSIGIYNSYNCRKKLIINLPVGSLVQNLQFRNNHLICILKTKRIIIYHTLLDYKELFTFNPKNYLNENKHELQKKNGESVQNLLALTIKGLAAIEVNSLYYDLYLNVVIFSSGKKIFFLNSLTNQSLGSYDFEAISCMEYNQHLATLFFGTFTGELVAFPWPNKPSNIYSQLPRFKFHSSKIIRIKLTSDFKYLITLGNDMSIYKSHISYVLNLKRLKGNQIAQYKDNKNSAIHCNFLYNNGICQFSHSQNIQKIQNKKDLEEEVVNTVFMLPEERLKQKQQLFQQISIAKEQLNAENMRQFQPLQQQSVGLRNSILKKKSDLAKLRRINEAIIYQEKQYFNKQTSSLLNFYSQLNEQQRTLRVNLKDQIKRLKLKNQSDYQNLIRQNSIKQKLIINKVTIKKQENQQHKTNFFELGLIEEEKQSFLFQKLLVFQKEFDIYTGKNGQLSCTNSSVQKQISILKHRIEELKFIILNTNYSIDKLKDKQAKESQEKLVFQTFQLENTKVNVSQMQNKYIQATKQLIEKNKLIDINLNKYEKQKELLVKLQKTVEGTEMQIDRVVDLLQEQKEFMKYLTQKKDFYISKFTQLSQLKILNKNNTKKTQTNLKKFIQELQELQKKIETSVNQNKKQLCSETYEIIQKLKSLQRFGVKKEPKEIQRTMNGQSNVQLISESNYKENQSWQSQKKENMLSAIITEIIKNAKTMPKQIKKPNLRYSSGQQRVNSSATCNLDSLDKNTNSRSKFKLNYNRFGQQYKKFHKDDGLNAFQPKSERIQNQSNFLGKMPNKYSQIKTQYWHKTQRQEIRFDRTNCQSKLQQMINQNSQQDLRATYSYNFQRIIQKQKQNLNKKFVQQQKIYKKIKNEKKLFMTNKMRLYNQNQDLINTYNSLTYDHKYFQNVIKAYEETLNEENKFFIFNKSTITKPVSKKFINISSTNNQSAQSKNIQNLLHHNPHSKFKVDHLSPEKFETPFHKYIKSKTTKIENTIKRKEKQPTCCNQFKNTLTKINIKKPLEPKRLKTLPSYQITF